MKNTKTKIIAVLVAVFIIGAVASGFVVAGYKADEERSRLLNEQLQEQMEALSEQTSSSQPSPIPEPGTSLAPQTPEPADDPEPSPSSSPKVSVDLLRNREGYLHRFVPVMESVADLVGWITIGENGEMNLPVVQAEDNEYYLHRSVDGTENRLGSIFVDYRNEPGIRWDNYILYGHHYLGGDQMFANLEKYHDAEYALKNDVFYYSDLTTEYDCYIFASYNILPTTWDYYKVTFADEQEYMNYVNDAIERSEVDYGVTVEPGEIMIQLSTCDYAFDDARQLIHAVMRPRD